MHFELLVARAFILITFLYTGLFEAIVSPAYHYYFNMKLEILHQYEILKIKNVLQIYFTLIVGSNMAY